MKTAVMLAELLNRREMLALMASIIQVQQTGNGFGRIALDFQYGRLHRVEPTISLLPNRDGEKN